MGVSADQNMRAQNVMNLIWELYFGFDVKNKLVSGHGDDKFYFCT